MLLYANASPRSTSAIRCDFGRMSYYPKQYGTLQFGQFEEIQKKGYNAAMEMLAKWDAEGRLPSAFIDGTDKATAGTKKGRSARRNSV